MQTSNNYKIEALFEPSAFKAPTLFCSQGHKIERFCVSPECKHESLCCNEDSCVCGFQHKLCTFRKLIQLNKAVEDVMSLENKFLRKLFQIQNQIMNRLMASRRQIIQKSNGWAMGVKSQTIDLIYSQNIIKGIKGKEMNETLLKLKQKSKAEKDIEEYLFSYKIEGDQMVAKFQQMRIDLFQKLAKDKKVIPTKQEELKKKIVQALSKQQKLQIPSKILAEDRDGLEKYSFLLKQLNNPQLKLIFRASQHSFFAASFHQCCDGISNTLTIVRTQFGKTIAAFTPLKWGTVDCEYVADNSQRSFLLQLELKQKMTVTEPQYAIYNHPNYGPCFGGGFDLCIVHLCNQNQNSASYFPHSYNCMRKYKNNQQSWTAFCGSPSGYKFRVLDYQVFAVSK